ncbi:MAG TPA: sigma-54 dependent transcriptional regulator [Opitutaceae bacterium]|nr:sigma-54 dependent transcriptional regulator [Opitutaceae bacterium]
MSLEKILIVDDEPIVCKALREILPKKRFTVATAGMLAEAEAALAREKFDLVFCDVRLPDGSGQDFLERMMAATEPPLVVMMTGYGSIESAVSCMRAGAYDYLLKPFTPDIIEVLLKKAESFGQLVKVNRILSESGDEGDLLGDSPVMRRLRQLILKVAPTDATVLLTGESGTGKEMVARELYRNSPRKSAPFIKVNCAAVSENLMESEFFGHERGAFTGATERREGRFELANGGTLLLDEISEIPMHLQAKLLRVLQEKEFERVGGNKTIKTNVRILATSNRDLLHSVAEGKFRQDLYYRLNVFPIHVPPLRERAEDVVLLADAFLKRYARKHGIKSAGWSEAAAAAIRAYSWPGNVRELQNTVERAVILAEPGRAIPPALLSLPVVAPTMAPTPPVTAPATVPVGAVVAPTPVPTPEPSVSAGAPAPSLATPSSEEGFLSLDDLEQKHILEALKKTGGNRTQAAAILKISIRTLRNKLNLYREQGVAVALIGQDEGD